MTAAASPALAGAGYPERDEPREGKLDRAVTALRYFTGAASLGRSQLARIVAATAKAAAGLDRLED
ncbi:MAG: hypothetical protein ACREVD_00880, partial [Burkholderiales bacterium]